MEAIAAEVLFIVSAAYAAIKKVWPVVVLATSLAVVYFEEAVKAAVN